MRNPDRIDPILTCLRSAWMANPDLRLGQLIVILANPSQPCPEVFYLEDDVLLDRLKAKKGK